MPSSGEPCWGIQPASSWHQGCRQWRAPRGAVPSNAAVEVGERDTLCAGQLLGRAAGGASPCEGTRTAMPWSCRLSSLLAWIGTPSCHFPFPYGGGPEAADPGALQSGAASERCGKVCCVRVVWRRWAGVRGASSEGWLRLSSAFVPALCPGKAEEPRRPASPAWPPFSSL